MNRRDFQTMLIQLRAAGCAVKSKRKGAHLTYKVWDSRGEWVLTANRLSDHYAIKSAAGVY